MADAVHIPNEAESRACFVIASEAKQSSVACACSGLPRRYAPRNDVVTNIRLFASSLLRAKQKKIGSREDAKARRVFAGALL